VPRPRRAEPGYLDAVDAGRVDAGRVDADPDADLEAGTAEPRPAPAPGSRRARRAELDQLADAMLLELAATQPRVTLPGPMTRVLATIGLVSGETKARRAVGIAVVCAVLVAAFVAVSAVAGLVL
jgi:hypothetical protein